MTPDQVVRLRGHAVRISIAADQFLQLADAADLRRRERQELPEWLTDDIRKTSRRLSELLLLFKEDAP